MKQKISILVLWRQERDENMYPHMYDFLNELEMWFDEVIYININMSYFDFYELDKNLSVKIKKKKCVAFESRLLYKKQNEFKDICQKLKKIKFRNNNFLIIAVDYLAFFIGKSIFKKNILFYSYDFIDKNSQAVKHNGVNKFLYEYTIANINDCLAVIIQDYNRGKEFEKSLNLKINKFIYLPVSLNDTNYSYQISKMKSDKVVNSGIIRITQIGDVKENRNYEILINNFDKFPENITFSFNGRIISKKIENKIAKCKKKIKINSTIVKSYDIPRKISDYDIGFVGYEEKDANLKYIERASGQLVEFLRLGMPIISIGPDSFMDFINENRIGIGLQEESEIINAIISVKDNYNDMSYNSRKKFEEEFCLENNFKNYFLNEVISLMKDKPIKRNRKNRLLKNILNDQYFIFNPLISNKFLKIINYYFYILEKFLIIKTSKNISKVKRVAIFGTGELANQYLKQLKCKNIEVIYFLDNSQDKWGKLLEYRIIKNLNYIMKDGYSEIDGVVLASDERKLEMWNDLKKVGFDKYIIFNIFD